MSATTKIEWCDATWNPITGCTPCSPGCDHCYAAAMVRRFPRLHCTCIDSDPGTAQYTFSTPHFHDARLTQPLHLRKPRRVFVCSMGDLFHPRVRGAWRQHVQETMWLAKQHTYLLLTKRPENVGTFCVGLPNAWLGVTVCNQAEADAKIPILLDTPAALRFVSVEPMLGPVDLERWLLSDYDRAAHEPQLLAPAKGFSHSKLNWVICGGETGPGARPMHPRWVRNLRDQCEEWGTPLFFKSWGEWAPYYVPCDAEGPDPRERGVIECDGGNETVKRVGKARAGRILDGREWSESPSCDVISRAMLRGEVAQ